MHGRVRRWSPPPLCHIVPWYPPHGSGTRHNGALGARVGLAGLQTCGESIRAGGKLLVSAAHVFAVSGRVRVAARVHGRVRRWWADQYAWAHSAQWWRVGARVGPGGLQTCGEWVRAGGQLLVSAAHEFASLGHVRVAARVRWRVRRWSPPPLQYHGSGTRHTGARGCPRGSSWSPNLRGVDPRVRTVAGRCHACVCSVGLRARGCLGALEGEAVVGGPVCVCP